MFFLSVGGESVGGDLPKEYKDSKDDIYKYPIYSNSLTNEGIYGFTNTYKIKGPAITITGRGAIGKTAYRVDNYYPIVRLVTLKPKKADEIDLKCTAYCINKVNFYNESSGVPQLTAPQIATYSIYIPFISEQIKVGLFLSSLDKKISVIESKIEALKKYRKGIINSWFKNNEKTLRLCELVRQQTSQFNIGTYPVYDATGRIYKSIDFYMNENDSIAIIKYGSGCGRTFITRDKHCVLGTMSELIPLNHDDLTYVFAFTESTKFKKICKKYIEVGTTPNLYYSDYSTELVYYPDERDNFVKLIDLINKKCVYLETEKENLGLLKQQLLKDMFI